MHSSLRRLLGLPQPEPSAARAVEHRLARLSKEVRATRRKLRRFEKRLLRRWRTAFDLYEATLNLAYQAGAELNDEEGHGGMAENDIQFDNLRRLHARACLIAHEIKTLMRYGYASGAYSRWRSLHELAVVAMVLREGDQELSARYQHHEVVESRRIAEQYRKYEDRLKLEPWPDDEIERLRGWLRQLEEQYGKSFREGQYGWAYELFNRSPNFVDLEKKAKLDHWRPYYKMASHGVHANAKGVMWNLGHGRLDDILLAGASDAGMVSPGQQALLSLNLVTIAFLTYRPSEERLLLLKALREMEKRATEAFLKADRSIGASTQDGDVSEADEG